MNQIAIKAIGERMGCLQLKTCGGLNWLSVGGDSANNHILNIMLTGPSHSLGEIKNFGGQGSAGNQHIVAE